MKIWRDLRDELKIMTKGKTFDALIPPLGYALLNPWLGLLGAAISAMLIAFLLGVMRAFKHQKFHYALVGFTGVVLASGFALFTSRAENYFLPGIIGNALLGIVCFVSVLFGRPLAAYASHLSRGWQLNWFWRKDVKPAYREVTLLWGLFITLRLMLSLMLYFQMDLTRLAVVRLSTGWPLTLLILIISYVYGVWRLRNLKGPSVEEFLSDVKPPFLGQRKGF